MPSITPAVPAKRAPQSDHFYPSSRFAKLPMEALSPLAWAGSHQMSHAEFRVFAALCHYRGLFLKVFVSQETLAEMTGISRNNVSRATKALQAKGWMNVHYVKGDASLGVENYEMLMPTPDSGTPPTKRKPKTARSKAVKAATRAAGGVGVPEAAVAPVAALEAGNGGSADTMDLDEFEREFGPCEFEVCRDDDDDSNCLSAFELERELAQAEAF